MKVTKILLGIPLFSLLSLVYASIGIGAIVISSLTSSVKSMTKLLLWIPLFSLLFKIKWHRTRHVRYAMKKFKGGFPKKMKISPIVDIPQNSKAFRSIMDLSFSLKLTPRGRVPLVNENNKKTAPGGAIDQIGHVLLHLIHAFTEEPDCVNIFQAK